MPLDVQPHFAVPAGAFCKLVDVSQNDAVAVNSLNFILQDTVCEKYV